MMKKKMDFKGRRFFYLSIISLGQDDIGSFYWFYYFNICWIFQSKCGGRVKWRYNEIWIIYDCDLFIQGDNLYIFGIREMVIDGGIGLFEG